MEMDFGLSSINASAQIEEQELLVDELNVLPDDIEYVQITSDVPHLSPAEHLVVEPEPIQVGNDLQPVALGPLPRQGISIDSFWRFVIQPP